MFDWIGDLIDAIAEAIREACEFLGTQISNTIWNTMLRWFYEPIYDAVADFFTMMGNISISQKNKRSRLGRPTSATCSSARARSSNAPAENTNGVTAHRRSPSEETCGFISTNESAAMLSTSSESI